MTIVRCRSVSYALCNVWTFYVVVVAAVVDDFPFRFCGRCCCCWLRNPSRSFFVEAARAGCLQFACIRVLAPNGLIFFQFRLPQRTVDDALAHWATSSVWIQCDRTCVRTVNCSRATAEYCNRVWRNFLFPVFGWVFYYCAVVHSAI